MPWQKKHCCPPAVSAERVVAMDEVLDAYEALYDPVPQGKGPARRPWQDHRACLSHTRVSTEGLLPVKADANGTSTRSPRGRSGLLAVLFFQRA
jgi:hypothetical protein